jgi:hypothetical protein
MLINQPTKVSTVLKENKKKDMVLEKIGRVDVLVNMQAIPCLVLWKN